MGHFFMHTDSDKVMGVNNGGVMLVIRRDLFDHPYGQAMERGKASCGISGMDFIFYPSGYISQLDAVRQHKKLFDCEKRVYEAMRPNLYAKYATFRAKELSSRVTPDLIDAILTIFFRIGSKLTHEFFSDREILNIAEKPSGMNTFFTGKTIGKTLGSCSVKKISDLECSENEVRFFAGDHNFMTVTRERCYT